MLIMVGVSAIVWIIFRRYGTKAAIVAFLLANLGLSFLIVSNVFSAGVERYDFESSSDREFSIVYYNSRALFPFVIQKQHNWTSNEFVHQVRYLTQDGHIIIQKGGPDQSEIMHISLFSISSFFAGIGFLLSGATVTYLEAFLRWREKMIVSGN